MGEGRGWAGVRGIRWVKVGDCVHTHSSYNISNPFGLWVGTGGWGQWGGLGLGELGGLGLGRGFTRNSLGFWVGTGGWGQWGGGRVGVRGITWVKVGDCVHTHSSYVISNPLGFWVGTRGVGTVGGVLLLRVQHGGE